MRKTTALLGWMLLLAGCQQSQVDKVIERLPDPLVQGPAAPAAARPAAPRPKPQPKPAPRRPTSTDAAAYRRRGWIPARGISPRWRCVVIHHSATCVGGAKRFDTFHRNVRGWDELGYHFVIGNGTDTPDGTIEVGSRWTKQKHGAHCKTPDNFYNDHGIGICLVGDFESAPPSAKQIASLIGLLEFLVEYAKIRPEQISTHGRVTGKTSCPGKHFPYHEVKRRLARQIWAASN
jgi:N-acetyl-anhydromuramyl-L-alanine amidase AmpD